LPASRQANSSSGSLISSWAIDLRLSSPSSSSLAVVRRLSSALQLARNCISQRHWRGSASGLKRSGPSSWNIHCSAFSGTPLSARGAT
jgi:hypothetical protein